MPETTHYVIRGGLQGRERLRVLSRVMHPTTSALLDRLALRDGLICADIGCGGGDATLELARRVGPTGSATGFDIDETKVEIARTEAKQIGVTNIDFSAIDIRKKPPVQPFDVIYARFLLTHLNDPASVVRTFFDCLRPGGVVAIEDIDFSGYFTYPESTLFHRYRDMYCAAVVRRGGDPNIGPRLPSLLHEAGFANVDVHTVQHVALRGDVKLINPLTMENIAGAVIEDGLATPEEIDRIVRELYDFAADPTTLAGTPRIVQSWGRRPA
jgi:ubiquinone/menaquinone biosynthesis C-methylase UbiE